MLGEEKYLNNTPRGWRRVKQNAFAPADHGFTTSSSLAKERLEAVSCDQVAGLACTAEPVRGRPQNSFQGREFLGSAEVEQGDERFGNGASLGRSTVGSLILTFLADRFSWVRPNKVLTSIRAFYDGAARANK